jgi:hypothetical protein
MGLFAKLSKTTSRGLLSALLPEQLQFPDGNNHSEPIAITPLKQQTLETFSRLTSGMEFPVPGIDGIIQTALLKATDQQIVDCVEGLKSILNAFTGTTAYKTAIANQQLAATEDKAE